MELRRLKLISWNIPVRYLRIWMTGSSNTCDTHGSQDKRNCIGYAINEVYVGTVSQDGQFTDLVKPPAEPETDSHVGFFCGSLALRFRHRLRGGRPDRL